MNGHQYTDEEIKFIIDIAKDKSICYSKIAKAFNEKFGTNQTTNQILHKINRLGLCHKERYTTEQINFIRDMVINNKMNYKQLTPLFNKKFKRNTSSQLLGDVAKRNGIRIRCTRNHGWYTDEQKAFIIDMVTNNKLGNNKLMIEFNKNFNENKNYDQIKHIVKVLGLSFDECNKCNEYTNEEKNFIVEMIVDEGMDYYSLTPLFNKKFGKNKTSEQIRSAGFRWGLKNIKRSYTWLSEDFFSNRLTTLKEYWCNRQDPIGTVKLFNFTRYSKHYIKLKLFTKEDYGKNVLNQNSKLFLEHWYPYDKYLYEKHNNVKLKKNEFIYHIDGDITNNDINNLMCANRKELGFAVANGLWKDDTNIKRLGLKLGKLNSILKNAEENE